MGRCWRSSPEREGPVGSVESAPSLRPPSGLRVYRRFAWGQRPGGLGEEGKSGVWGSRPHTPGALWNEILINY